jgi:pimeloyl-ACP methyl ester carboxylesterase
MPCRNDGLLLNAVVACWRRQLAQHWRTVLCLAAGLTLVVAGCTTPVRVARVDPREVERQLDSNVISTHQLSEATRLVLYRENLLERFDTDPDDALASLHRTLAAEPADPDVLFALAEMSFFLALGPGQQQHALSAAVYAYAFLFPEHPQQRLSGFDPRLRTACDIYNRSLTRAFASADRSRLELHAGRYGLSFGSIEVTFDPAGARWGEQILSNFTPIDELRITGLKIRYRRPGIGASLAADATPQVQEHGFQVEPDVKVPVTALLRVETSRPGLAEGRLRGSLEIYPAFEPSDITIAGQSVPLEVDTSTAFAFSLSDPKVWESELAGFFDGNFVHRTAAHLVGLEPYRRGQIPVVIIHGTGSSAGRWANLVNDLQSDSVIREGYQFWSFSYASGNPTSFSAAQLREVLAAAVHTLDPHGQDPALRNIVLIGHSQGGLLAKWMTIESGSQLWDTFSDKPPEALRLSAQSRSLLRQVFFVTPLPEIRRVIFIATPHHGSFVADSPLGQLVARFVTPRAPIMTALRDLTEDNPADLRFNPGSTRFGSIWSMTPANPLLQAFAAIPVAPTVAAHSIIAVQGDGPVETGDDGVVTYKSAHIPEAVSELVVRAGHSVQAEPQTVREVRRILLRHLAEVCPTSCVPVNARDRQPLALRALDAAAPPSPRVASARPGRFPVQDQGGAQ